MKIIQVILSCGGLLCLLACRSSVPAAGYIRYIESAESGLHIQKESGKVRFSIQYKPIEYLALQNDPAHDPGKAGAQSEDLKGFLYFNFCIGSSDGSSLLEGTDNSAEHFERLNYCEFSMQNDFTLVIGKDTVPCGMYHFERSYNLSPNNNFILAFPDKNSYKNQADLSLVYTDHLFGTGKSVFTIKARDLENIPALKTL